MDDEITHLLTGWAAIFLGGSVVVWSVVAGLPLVGLLWTLVVSAGILVLVYAFVRFRVPEIIKFFKNGGFKEWTQSLGL